MTHSISEISSGSKLGQPSKTHMAFRVIGIHGKKRVGKDVLAGELLKATPIVVLPMKLSFADPLKEELAQACGVSLAYLEEHKENFRLLLQGWGTEFRRKLFTENYWINKMRIRLLEEEAQGHKLFIIPDVRFQNEYDFVKSLGGLMIHIHRNIPSLDTHESERTIQAKFDYVVDNNGDISHLKFVAEQLISKYVCPQ